jgi:hypothetical protein
MTAVRETIDAAQPYELRPPEPLAAATLATQGHADVLIDGRHLPLSEFFLTDHR